MKKKGNSCHVAHLSVGRRRRHIRVSTKRKFICVQEFRCSFPISRRQTTKSYHTTTRQFLCFSYFCLIFFGRVVSRYKSRDKNTVVLFLSLYLSIRYYVLFIFCSCCRLQRARASVFVTATAIQHISNNTLRGTGTQVYLKAIVILKSARTQSSQL